MKKMRMIALLCALAMLTTACGELQAPVVDMGDVESSTFEESAEVAEGDEATANSDEVASAGKFSFEDISGLTFLYNSAGMGGWHTELTVDKSGKFQGIHQEYALGVSGKGYNGTISYSEVTGQFMKPEKVDDTTYKLKLKSIKHTLGKTEKIVDEIRYIYGDAQGISDGKEFYVYLPGTKVADLPKEFADVADDALLSKEETNFYGIYNKTVGAAFVGVETVAPAKVAEDIIDEALTKTLELKNQRTKASTQQEVNMLTYEIYQEWDIALNHVWSIVGDTLDEKTYAKLFKEEEKWIAKKRAMKKRLYAEFDEVYMADYVVYSESAEMTKDRAYELLEYLKEK